MVVGFQQQTLAFSRPFPPPPLTALLQGFFLAGHESPEPESSPQQITCLHLLLSHMLLRHLSFTVPMNHL